MIRRIHPRDWRSLVSVWAIACVVIGAVVGFATADEMRAARDAGLSTAWFVAALGACIAMILVGCAGAIMLARGAR